MIRCVLRESAEEINSRYRQQPSTRVIKNEKEWIKLESRPSESARLLPKASARVAGRRSPSRAKVKATQVCSPPEASVKVKT
jgi:hypothetical protein